MARFDLSGFAPAADEAAPAAPPPAADPIDTIRINGALNDFLAAKQDALFDAPDAFYRTAGRDAVEAAPAAYDRLEQLGSDAMAGLDNDTQRRPLRDQLDAQLHLAREDMGRHVAEQTKAWQRQTARDRVDLLTREAALHHGDAGLHDSLATAAEVAARAHAAPDEADPAAAGARSGIFHAAIQALLDRGNTDDAAAQLDRRKDQLADDHAGSLQAQLATARRFDTARAYADSVVPTDPPATAAEIEAQRAATLRQVEADHADDPLQRMLTQHLVESAYDRHRGTLGRIKDDIVAALEQWRALSTGKGLPPPSLWNRLDPQQQARLLVQLRLNDGRPTEAEPTPADDAAEPTMLSDADPEPMEEGQQYAQASPPGGPPRRLGPGGRDLTVPEQNRWTFFDLHRNELERLEPDNPRLPYISRPGWVPSQRNVEEMAREVAAARARAAARAQSGGEATDPKAPPPTVDDIVRGTVRGGLTDKQDRGVLRPQSPPGEGEPPRRIGDNPGTFPEEGEQSSLQRPAYPNPRGTTDRERYGFTVRYPTPEMDPKKEMKPISQAEKESIANVLSKIARGDFRGLRTHKYENDPHWRTGAVLPSSQYGYIAVDIPGVGSTGRGEGRFVVEKVTGKAYYSNVHYMGFVPIERDTPKGTNP